MRAALLRAALLWAAVGAIVTDNGREVRRVTLPAGHITSFFRAEGVAMIGGLQPVADLSNLQGHQGL